MRFKLFFYSVFLFFLLFCNEVFAQKQFKVTIQIPDRLDRNSLYLSYDNGKEMIEVKPEFEGSKITISDTFYSRYAALEMGYPSGNPMLPHYKIFFVTDKPAAVSFAADNSLENPFENFEVKNAYDVNGMGADKMRAFVSAEEKDFFGFMAANGGKLGFSDSLAAAAFQKSTRLAAKKAAFVKQNGDLYYSFWLFRKELASNPLLSADSLLAIFNTAFPADFRQSKEGAAIEKVLRGNNIKKGQKAPGFSVSDSSGNAVALADYRGKYLLINFWASWCKPCLEEMPVITEMRKRYPTDKLEVVFVTLDTNPAAAAKAVKKYGMEGVHVVASDDLISTFGAQAIPVVYLVDPEGKVVYSRDEEKDFQLQLLSEVLRERL